MTTQQLLLQVPIELHQLQLAADPEAVWTLGFVAGEPQARARRRPTALLMTVLCRTQPGHATHYTARYIACAALIPPHLDAAVEQTLTLEHALWARKKAGCYRGASAAQRMWWSAMEPADIIAHRLTNVKPRAVPLCMTLYDAASGISRTVAAIADSDDAPARGDTDASDDA